MQNKLSILRKIKNIGFLFFVLLLTTNSFAIINRGPLPKEEAFKFAITIKNPEELIANWEIAPGYYLYREHFNFSFDPKLAYEVHYPPSQLKSTPTDNKVEVYAGHLSLPISLKEHPHLQKFNLSVNYQGCSKNGFCYPPMHQNIAIDLANGSSVSSDNPALKSSLALLPGLLKDQQGVLSLLYSEHFVGLIFMFVFLGILLAFTPCVLPMVPILTSIIVGQRETLTTRSAFFLALTYVLGTAMTYAAAGVLAAAMGSSLQVWLQQTWIIVLMSSLFVLLALSLFGYYDLKLPNGMQQRVIQLSNKQQGGTYIGVFMMGLLSTLIVSPCVTAPLVGVLMYIGQTGNLWFGGSALFALGIGMGIPLILVGVSAGKWLPKRGPWMETLKKLFGLAMLGMALWLLSRVLSPTMTSLAWGAFILSWAVFLGIHLPKLIGLTLLNRSLGISFGLLACLFMLNAAGVETPIAQWVKSPMELNSAKVRPFVVVHNIQDLKQQLQQARLENKPVILDFYADWCDSCVAMDRNVFSKSIVQNKLAQYTLLRADLSANTAMDEAILRQYDVIAPPTILFFDPEGREFNTQRIVGEVDANEFVNHMTTLWNQIALQN